MIRKRPDSGEETPAAAAGDDADSAPADAPDAGSADSPQAEDASPEITAEAGSAPEAETEDAVADDATSPDSDHPLPERLEALLFASGQALSVRRLAALMELDGDTIKAALDELVARWADRPGAVELTEIAGGFRFMTRPEYHADLDRLNRKRGPEKLSPAALETLAVVAYKQPLTRADVEAVRGVQCGPLLRVLLERDLIRIAGRSPEPGHPLLYGTTKRFLDHFGLPSLKQLPDLKDLLQAP